MLYQGKRHRSLSEVAHLITGSRWSGPLFFGLKTRAKGRRARFSPSRPSPESAGNNGDEGTHEREHPSDTTPTRNLDFLPLSEFSVSTPTGILASDAMKRCNQMLRILALILAASLSVASGARAQTSQQVIFRVEVGDLLVQDNRLAKGKVPAEFASCSTWSDFRGLSGGAR